MATRDLKQRVFFKKVKKTYRIQNTPFTGDDKFWGIAYTAHGVTQIIYWNKYTEVSKKSRTYTSKNLPKAIKAWLTVQGIPLIEGIPVRNTTIH